MNSDRAARSSPSIDLPRPETRFSKQAKFRWAGHLGALLLRLWGKTWRIETDLHPETAALQRVTGNFLWAFWHEHLLSLTYTHRNRGATVLVSESADGEYISQTLHRLGYGTVRGSSSRSAVRALLETAKLGRQGATLAITPDGPRGPRHRVQPGVLVIAQRAQIPIIPITSAAKSSKRLRSWDRFEVPWPFSRVKVWEGPPVRIDASVPAERLEIEMGPVVQAALDDLETKAAAWLGRGDDAGVDGS